MTKKLVSSYARKEQDIIGKRNYKCELCRTEEKNGAPLSVYFIDRDPSNWKEKNLAVLCPSCRSIFSLSNPTGLNSDGGLFDFAVNRGLYNLRNRSVAP